MAALFWTVLSALLLIESSAAVEEAELATIVTQLLNVYKPTYQNNGHTPTFTLAVSVPLNPTTRRYDVTQVTAADNGQNVKDTLDRCEVYEGSRVMGASVLKWPDIKNRNQCHNTPIPNSWAFVRELCPTVRTWGDLREACTSSINKKLSKSENGAVDHAEYRVLNSFNYFRNRLNSGQLNRNDLLVLYSSKAPCDGRCANPANTRWNIIDLIRGINDWQNHVLVFSDIFEPVSTNIPQAQQETNRRTALTTLGTSIGGLGNIYRCRLNRCSRCSAQTGVANTCVSDTVQSRSPSPNGK